MPLLGSAAMLLSFDIVEAARAEHDDWHTHEHLPERLSIPGFLRGTRWAARRGQPGYVVLYEVESLAVLNSTPYLARLNNPSAWTTRLMPHYRGMTRGLCNVIGSVGLGAGHLALLLRLRPEADGDARLRTWLLQELLPTLPARPGLGSAHLLEAAAAPAMTNEQRIRGADAGMDWALFVTGYGEAQLESLLQGELAAANVAQHGGRVLGDALYRVDYSLSRAEIA